MKVLNKIYKIWWGVACLISLFLLIFEGNRIRDYVLGKYYSSSMKITKIDFTTSNSDRKAIDVEGNTSNKNVYFSLYDNSRKYLFEYLNEVSKNNPKQINYNKIDQEDIILPVVVFESSKKVILILKNSTKKEAISRWKKPKILALLIAYIPLIILSIKNKRFKNV